MPTPYTGADDAIADLGTQVRRASDPAAGVLLAEELVRDRLAYARGATHVGTAAAEALAAGAGVCQDFVHLTLAVLRSAGVPCRYASGYLLPDAGAEVGATVAGESHAWLEAWTGAWVPIDPTNGRPVGPEHVLVARGARLRRRPAAARCVPRWPGRGPRRPGRGDPPRVSDASARSGPRETVPRRSRGPCSSRRSPNRHGAGIPPGPIVPTTRVASTPGRAPPGLSSGGPGRLCPTVVPDHPTIASNGVPMTTHRSPPVDVRLQGRGSHPGRVRPQGDPARRARDARPHGTARAVLGDQAPRRRPHHRVAAHDDPDRGAHRDAHRARCRGPLGLLQHLLHPGPRRRRDRGDRRPGVRVEGRDARGVLVVHRARRSSGPTTTART